MKNRKEHVSQELEKARELEHNSSYGTKEFRWLWHDNGVDCPGVWACGGYSKDMPPKLIEVWLLKPKSKSVRGWYCYIGPTPKFSDTIYYEEHSEGVRINESDTKNCFI